MNIKRQSTGLTLTVLVIALCAISAVAPLFAPHNPNESNLKVARQGPSVEYPFGTDALGRCVLSRTLAGAPTSVFSSLLIVGITAVVGCVIGVISGYFGGMVDRVLMGMVDLFMPFPGMVLAIAVAGILGRGLTNAVIALAVVGWPQYTRLARSSVLALREMNFIYAARLEGQSPIVILYRHVLPNSVRPVIVMAAMHIGTAVMELAGLSFLGLGVQPPTPEWGSMLADARSLMQLCPWLILGPGIAICLTTIAFNLLGDGVRDALDPVGKTNVADGGF
jgi:ABC-type dipeptide/oligopeptide/nickel transport system permease subunit